jgi:Domain of unknown function (DUF1707)/Cell wall-active antibiotics response 4TMS YvqF
MPVPRGGARRDEPDRNEDLLARGDDWPVIRASDGEREAAVARLNDAVGEGRLTLQEFSERLDRAYTASTRGTLAQLTADLPGMDLVRGPARHRRVMLGLLFDSRRAGPRPLDDEITAIAFLGDVIIDLRDAKITANEITIRAYALLNDVDVIVPEGVAIELSGVAIVGDNRNMVKPVAAGTSRLVVKIHGHAVLGDVQVFHHNPRAPRASRRRSIES